MAYIAYGAGANAGFPSIYSDPKYPKDIVINGILFDIDTFTPKIGSNVMAYTGDYSAGTNKSYVTFDDDDIYYFGIWNNDSISGQYTAIMCPNYPYVQRDIQSGGAHYDTGYTTSFLFNYMSGQTALWGRDFLDYPIRASQYNSAISRYIQMTISNNYIGYVRNFEGEDGYTLYQNLAYMTGGSGIVSWLIDAETDSGMLFVKHHSSATVNTQKLSTYNYSSHPTLETTAQIELYAPTVANPCYIHYLTKSNNGDHYFLTHQGDAGVGGGDHATILRYDNSTNSVVIEYDNFENAASHTYPMTIPSNVVYHQKTGDTSTSKKICYYMPIKVSTFDAVSNTPWFIEIDTANNTITNTKVTTYTPPPLLGADDDLTTAYFLEGEGPHVMIEQRILSTSQSIDSQKYFFVFTQSNGYSGLATYDHSYMITKIDAANPLNLTALSDTSTYGVWENILTASAKNTDPNDIVPWCVAPLNTEHTLMMVYTKFSTHLVKFDTSAETLSEVWMDDDTVFNEVMWLPTGKVLTTQFENKFSVNGAAIDWHAPKPIQVWSEDLIYNVNITAAADYVEYAGSDVPNTLTISAYDGSDSRVATDLTLKIIGPAVFDNNTATKTVTTSNSADVTETITIQDDGHIEVQVVEIQS